MISIMSRIGSKQYRHSFVAALVALCFGFVTCGSVSAQYLSGTGTEGISAMGSGQVSLEPQKLRLTMWIQAQGIDAKSAAQALAAHQEQVREDLLAMNADEDSIEFSTTRFKSDEPDEQQRAMMMMMQSQLGSSPLDSDAADALPEIITAQSALKVEWELPTADTQALAILPEGLKQQIIDRDLAGEKNKPDLTEEQLEQLEEAEAMLEEATGGFSYSTSTESTQPRIVFVAQAEPAQRQSAMKQAFDQARRSAALLAAAAGVELGALKGVASNDLQSDMVQVMAYTGYGQSDEMPFAQAAPGEVTSPTLDGLVLRISVMAAYEL